MPRRARSSWPAARNSWRPRSLGLALLSAACSPEACLTPPPAPNEGSGGTGGLFPPQSGGVPVTGGTGGAPLDAGDDAAPSTGGALGTGGMPLPCLSPAQSAPDPKDDGSEE